MITDIDLDVSEKEQKYLATIRGIRARNFGNNIPFLIISDKLPEGQVYREFPDGHIELQSVFSIDANFESKTIKTLSPAEANQVLTEHRLF